MQNLGDCSVREKTYTTLWTEPLLRLGYSQEVALQTLLYHLHLLQLREEKQQEFVHLVSVLSVDSHAVVQCTIEQEGLPQIS